MEDGEADRLIASLCLQEGATTESVSNLTPSPPVPPSVDVCSQKKSGQHSRLRWTR